MPFAPTEARGATRSRRRTLALMLGIPALRRILRAADPIPVRLAISASVIGDVNLNDAKAAMLIWLKRMAQDMNIQFDPKLFATTPEIVEGIRKGQLDCVALNVLEYRPIADFLDSSQIVNASGEAGTEQYLILAKRNSAIRNLADLKGRRLCVLKTPKMCVAPAWLLTVLDEAHYGPAEQFFGSVVNDSKVARVVLPVFFGQADACLTTKRGFDTMCELNPQVGRDLFVLASSPPMVVDFYIFRKNYRNAYREKVINAIMSLHATVAGQQLATLFQFQELTIRDASCLGSVLAVLDRADRARARLRD